MLSRTLLNIPLGVTSNMIVTSLYRYCRAKSTLIRGHEMEIVRSMKYERFCYGEPTLHLQMLRFEIFSVAQRVPEHVQVARVHSKTDPGQAASASTSAYTAYSNR